VTRPLTCQGNNTVMCVMDMSGLGRVSRESEGESEAVGLHGRDVVKKWDSRGE
jgi:hypothetical protein